MCSTLFICIPALYKPAEGVRAHAVFAKGAEKKTTVPVTILFLIKYLRFDTLTSLCFKTAAQFLL